MNSFFEGKGQLFAVQVEPRQYLLRMDLPGLSRNDLGVKVEQGLLSIMRGAQQTNALVEEVRLPQDVEASSVVADFRGGVLRVRLPRVSQKRSWWPC